MNRRIYILFIIILLIHNALIAQSREELEERKQKNLEELRYTNQLLEKVKKNKKSSIQELMIINKRIELRNNIINSIKNEIIELNNILEEKRIVINLLEDDLEKLKKEYAKILVYTYKNLRAYNKIMFILSAKNFNQAYKRIKYLNQYSEYRKKQAKIIQEIQIIIKKERKSIKQKILDKEILVSNKKEEKIKLSNEKDESKMMISQLKSKESRLLEKIEEKKRLTANIENQIQKIIEEEARKKKGKNLYYKLTPEERIISDNFSNNKGKLPWPTRRGIITNEFGKHEHPVLRGVYVNNNGVDITTTKGESVRAIFKGEVSKVIAIKGSNYTVIIRHGNFLTVYNNLVNVRVKTGDKVDVKEIIGDVYYNKDDESSVLHIEIWNELEKLNPEIWLAKGKK